MIKKLSFFFCVFLIPLVSSAPFYFNPCGVEARIVEGFVKDISSYDEVYLPRYFLDLEIVKILEDDFEEDFSSCSKFREGDLINVRLNYLLLESEGIELKKGQIIELYIEYGVDERGVLPYIAGNEIYLDEYKKIKIIYDVENSSENKIAFKSDFPFLIILSVFTLILFVILFVWLYKKRNDF